MRYLYSQKAFDVYNSLEVNEFITNSPTNHLVLNKALLEKILYSRMVHSSVVHEVTLILDEHIKSMNKDYFTPEFNDGM
tara:strand:+ start:3343 stop:3579 length:237 start_codon:yes stop_codon:yes gene_type:complete